MTLTFVRPWTWISEKLRADRNLARVEPIAPVAEKLN